MGPAHLFGLRRSIAWALMLATSLSACAPSMPDPEVTTLHGQIRGAPSDYGADVRVFKGIPYAEAPVGERRWQPPQAMGRWSEPLDATRFSPSCVQPRNTSTFVWQRGDFDVSEDCLYLNVWTPEDATELPVMVWFHGGAHTSGQGHAKIFDGTRLAREGVVLVTLNYRLGPLGFLAHPWLAEESPHDSAGNYGLLDKIAALNWLRDNVAGFGGDPDNITIFGQSAGAQSICSLMVSPLARGLFHKAIGQSAACVLPGSSRDQNGHERGAELVAALNVTDLEAMRRLPAERLLEAAEATGWANRDRLVIDGWAVPNSQIERFRAGQFEGVPMLLGSLANEGIELIPIDTTLTRPALDEFLNRMFGGPDLLKYYGDALAISPGHAQQAIATDLFMAFSMRRWAEYASRRATAYLYFMDHVPPAFHLYWPDGPGLKLPGGPRAGGAYHSGDLALVFGTLGKVGHDWAPSDQAVSDLMIGYWTQFAKTGDPNGPGRPRWDPFSDRTMATLRLNAHPEMIDGARREALDAMIAGFPADSL